MIRLSPDLPGTAELLEVIQVGRDQIGLMGAEDFVKGYVQLLGFFAIDLGEELRNVCPEGDVGTE